MTLAISTGPLAARAASSKRDELDEQQDHGNDGKERRGQRRLCGDANAGHVTNAEVTGRQAIDGGNE